MKAQQLPPVEQASPAYDLKDLRSPVLSGTALNVFAKALEVEAIGNLVYPIIFTNSGITALMHGPAIPDRPTFLPDLPVPPAGTPEPGCAVLPKHRTQEEAVESALQSGFLRSPPASSPPWRASVRDYLAAYKSGSITPTGAMERIVAFIKASEAKKPWPCKWLAAWSEEDILRQAKESAHRYQQGTPRLLEGVPFVVKDAVDALPYPTTAGTSFLPSHRSVKASAPVVLALQRMGAVLLGKSTMHEVGLGVTGLNLRTGTPLNPWGRGGQPEHYCGGSSGGSAGAVGSGLVPFAIGSDGGGSIRVPSSFCGCVGLKPSSGRVTGKGGVEIDCTVATYGPIGGSVEDTALLYSVMANQELTMTLQGEPLPAPQLPKPLPSAAADTQAPGSLPLAGVRLGVFWPWFEDCDAEVRSCCRAALDTAVAQGATLVDVTIPELELLRVAHSMTIVSEMRNCMQRYLDNPQTRAAFNTEVRLGLMAARKWTGAHYVAAQRVRTRGIAHFRAALQQVDVLVTPATPCTAPAISPAAYNGGMSDLNKTSAIMRFVSQANMLGLPAISVPVGCDSSNLPIGLQFMGRPWAEATLLRLAAVMESAMAQQQRQQTPVIWINPVSGQSAGL